MKSNFSSSALVFAFHFGAGGASKKASCTAMDRPQNGVLEEPSRLVFEGCKIFWRGLLEGYILKLYFYLKELRLKEISKA